MARGQTTEIVRYPDGSVKARGTRIGGYDDLRRFFGKTVADPKAVTYRPVAVVFAMTALMALAASYAVLGTPFTVRAGEWFIAFSMCVLALLKLQNVEKFATMFLNYDLLAKRWVPYSYIYPYAEGAAGVLMAAGSLISVLIDRFGWIVYLGAGAICLTGARMVLEDGLVEPLLSGGGPLGAGAIRQRLNDAEPETSLGLPPARPP